MSQLQPTADARRQTRTAQLLFLRRDELSSNKGPSKATAAGLGPAELTVPSVGRYTSPLPTGHTATRDPALSHTYKYKYIREDRELTRWRSQNITSNRHLIVISLTRSLSGNRASQQDGDGTARRERGWGDRAFVQFREENSSFEFLHSRGYISNMQILL
jgi:hypothetical protein